MKKLRERWGIHSNGRLAIILIIFAITGSSAAKLAKPLTEIIGIHRETSWSIYWLVRILIILPIYQLILIVVAWLFGEFHFFWKFIKKILRFIPFYILLVNG